jgi:hypothetical protein
MRSKKVMGWNEYSLLRAIVGLAIVVYIVGIVPSYSKAVSDLFHEPVVKLIFLGLIVAVGYMDSTLGVLLAVAFLVSMLSSAKYKTTPLGQVVSGVQGGARQVVSGVQDGAKEVVSGVQTGAKEVVKVPEHVVSGVHSLTKEMMNNPDYQTPNAQQAFELSQQNGNELLGQGSNCTVVPPPTTGCDPIVGYNASYDCVSNGNCAEDGKNRGCLCTGVATWEDELNAQGLNYPMGYAGEQDGATYN